MGKERRRREEEGKGRGGEGYWGGTCLWKVRRRRAFSSMLALVLRSPAREPGSCSNSWIRWAIRAWSLHTHTPTSVVHEPLVHMEPI